MVVVVVVVMLKIWYEDPGRYYKVDEKPLLLVCVGQQCGE
jgi:hypothetical protein